MNRNELKKIMPHREPMLLLDEATRIEENKGIAKYEVRGDEFFLQGHFPGNPIVPGVIQCEMMAQSCAVLFESEGGFTPLFTGIKECKFKRPVKPGDVLEIHVEITKAKPPFYFAKARVLVDGALASQAEISFALVDTDV